MNVSILDDEIQSFIDQNLQVEPAVLMLKGSSFDNVSTVEIVEQIEAKKKAKYKLPTWFESGGIYYPNKLNIEQTSSEITARYKSELIQGESLIDLTGGFGVDTFYFSKTFDQVTYCELNSDLFEIVRHNFEVFKLSNVKLFNTDGLELLHNNSDTYDWIYVDPSRRHDSKGKVFFLKDCLPNVPKHLDFLWARSKRIMMKTSPLLDITSGKNELDFVKSVHVIAVNNEVKELLWILENGFVGRMKIQTANLIKKGIEQFEFFPDQESEIELNYGQPLTYLYEPNSAILKSGGFNSLTAAFKVQKLHQHSHLYTSELLIDFPGRRFRILKSLPYNKKQIKRLSLKKANITTRNFPETVENLRKILKIKDGGEAYLFFTTTMNNDKIVLICEKLN